MEEKTDWTIVSSWPKRTDDDKDTGSLTKTLDYGRSQYNRIGGDKSK